MEDSDIEELEPNNGSGDSEDDYYINNSVIQKVKSCVSSIVPRSVAKWFTPSTGKNDESALYLEEDTDEDDKQHIVFHGNLLSQTLDENFNESNVNCYDERQPHPSTGHSHAEQNINLKDQHIKMKRPLLDTEATNNYSISLHPPFSASLPCIENNLPSGNPYRKYAKRGYASNTSRRCKHLNLYSGNFGPKPPPYDFHSASTRQFRHELNNANDIDRFSLQELNTNKLAGDSCNSSSGLSSQIALNFHSHSKERNIHNKHTSGKSTPVADHSYCSPFYEGKTTYGGASAYKRYTSGARMHLKRATKPTACTSTFSSTTQRLLDTLNGCDAPNETHRNLMLHQRPQPKDNLKHSGSMLPVHMYPTENTQLREPQRPPPTSDYLHSICKEISIANLSQIGSHHKCKPENAPTKMHSKTETNFKFSSPLILRGLDIPISNVMPAKSIFQFSEPIVAPNNNNKTLQQQYSEGPALRICNVLEALDKPLLPLVSIGDAVKMTAELTSSKMNSDQLNSDMVSDDDMTKYIVGDTLRKQEDAADDVSTSSAASTENIVFTVDSELKKSNRECKCCYKRKSSIPEECLACKKSRKDTCATRPTLSTAVSQLSLDQNTFNDVLTSRSDEWEWPTYPMANENEWNDFYDYEMRQTNKPSTNVTTTITTTTATATTATLSRSLATIGNASANPGTFKFNLTPSASSIVASTSTDASQLASAKWKCEGCMMFNDNSHSKGICCHLPMSRSHVFSDTMAKFLFMSTLTGNLNFNLPVTAIITPNDTANATISVAPAATERSALVIDEETGNPPSGFELIADRPDPTLRSAMNAASPLFAENTVGISPTSKSSVGTAMDITQSTMRIASAATMPSAVINVGLSSSINTTFGNATILSSSSTNISQNSSVFSSNSFGAAAPTTTSSFCPERFDSNVSATACFVGTVKVVDSKTHSRFGSPTGTEEPPITPEDQRSFHFGDHKELTSEPGVERSTDSAQDAATNSFVSCPPSQRNSDSPHKWAH